MTDERIQSGYAALGTDSTETPIPASGVALGEGDITRGGSGKTTLWPRETLEPAADGLAGQPLASDDNHTAEGAQPQTPSDAVRGAVTWSGYKPGVGVLWEGEIDDPDIARSVENDRLEVSPLVSRDVEPLEGELAEKYREKGYDVEAAEFVATEIHGWRDLATVVKGAAPSNEITTGDHPMKAEALHEAVRTLQTDNEDVASASNADSGEALQRADARTPEYDGTESADWSAVSKDLSAVTDALGIDADSTEDLTDEQKSDIVAHTLLGDADAETWDELFVFPVVNPATGDLNENALDAVRGGRGEQADIPEDTYASAESAARDLLAEEFGREFEESMADEPAESGAESPQSDDGPHGGTDQSSVADSDTEDTMTENELTDTDKAVLEAAESIEEPVEALEAYAAAEQPEVVEQDTYDALTDAVDTLDGMMSEALTEETGLSERAVEAMSFEAKAAHFETDDGAFNAEALIQRPETGDPEEDDTESLSENADVEKAEALYADMEEFGVDHSDTICEALGVDEWDTAEEVLN